MQMQGFIRQSRIQNRQNEAHINAFRKSVYDVVQDMGSFESLKKSVV
jgi:hypothetical protein